MESAAINYSRASALPRFSALELSGQWKTTAKITALKTASYLTDPICKVREYFYTFYILDEVCESTAQKAIKVTYLILGISVYTLLAPFTAPVGAIIRGTISTFSSKPYLYLKKGPQGKTLPENRIITIASKNACRIKGGFDISDGQVTPDQKRLDANIEELKKVDPDVGCLFEISDICEADYISSQLPNHPFVIPIAGIRGIGPSSMICIVSKYQIVEESIEFTPFEKGSELTGRSQYSEKGILSFDIKNPKDEAPFATIFSTHLQHSEIPEYSKRFVENPEYNPSEDEDIKARSAQLQKVISKMNKLWKKIPKRPVIFTGDLNCEETELQKFLTTHQIDYLKRDQKVVGKPTWGGDTWCANLMGKTPSNPLTLDYTFGANIQNISTKIMNNDFCGSYFKPSATSDHNLLLSEITISQPSNVRSNL